MHRLHIDLKIETMRHGEVLFPRAVAAFGGSRPIPGFVSILVSPGGRKAGVPMTSGGDMCFNLRNPKKHRG